jgi:hypothetical protein
MKRLMTIVAIVSLALLRTPTTASASVEKGQKIFKKKFRKYCRFSGVKFARHHTRAEWEDVYEFSYKYASDGVVQKC